ncbi:NAD(P)H-dependent oxidoreductase [Pseudoruegeria sp. HB172150]|uniref:NAD(P)H-dependent oxidoreductase n=1 Tax=Pseudoruegeria sp. HB172150 TaxID=2721164 RepID=UPI0015519DFC|nr:flagellar biosynthesis protein FlgA [Pseudoruegeria sp. HB172150]
MTNPSNGLLAALDAREAEGRPVRVGVVGTGDYGESLVAQIGQIPGMTVSVVCDLLPERSYAAYAHGGVGRDDVRVAGRLSQLEDAIHYGRPAITEDAALVAEVDIDVVVDCTGEVNFGAELALSSIRQGKHVVMVNVETDVTAGVQLADEARRQGVVYTLADGDQPSLIVGLADWAEALGFEVVAAGKWTSLFPEDQAGARLAAIGDPRKSDVTYFDGTKTQIEMAATANAAGLDIDVPGLHRIAVAAERLPDCLRPKEHGGILGRSGIVDVVDGRQLNAGEFYPGGVFTIVTSPADRAMRAMAAKGVPVSDDGRYALLYRPYHLVGAETPRSIALAAIEGLPTAAPVSQRVEVVGVAKRRLEAGTRLGGQGTMDVRGEAVNADGAEDYLPLGLVDDAKLTRALSPGERLRMSDVVPPNDSTVWRLRSPGRKVA